MKCIRILLVLLIVGVQLSAQHKTPASVLAQMVDSVNYMLKNCKDGLVQPVFSINTKGDISLLDKNESGFRFPISSLNAQDSGQMENQGITFVPEDNRSITMNKFILFVDKKKNTIALLKFVSTTDDDVRKIYALLLRVRSYFFTHFSN